VAQNNYTQSVKLLNHSSYNTTIITAFVDVEAQLTAEFPSSQSDTSMSLYHPWPHHAQSMLPFYSISCCTLHRTHGPLRSRAPRTHGIPQGRDLGNLWNSKDPQRFELLVEVMAYAAS